MKELRKQQADKYQKKSNFLNTGQEIMSKNQPQGGLISLEDMKLDNNDADVSNFDPFYNPLTGGSGMQNEETITLKE